VSKNDEASMIGYDPLAWMHEEKHQQRSSLESEPDNELSNLTEQYQTCQAESDVDSSIDADAVLNDSQDIQVENVTLVTPDNILSAHPQQIVLESVQNIQNVSQLYEQALYALQNSEKIDIDASAITSIDTATLQLLLILKRTAIKRQKEVSIDFPSDKFIEVANLLGLSEMLDVDQAASGFF
jgi:ABC-type transporter Mla MlaB component